MEMCGHRRIRRPNRVDRYILRKDIKEKGVKIEEAQYQSTWRLKAPCADPNKGKAEEEET